MNRLEKTTSLPGLLILSIFLTAAFLLGVAPGTAQAAAPSILTQLPASTPGNFTVTWYTGKRYFPGQAPGSPHAGEIFTNLFFGPVDKDASDAALQSWDTSVCLGQEHIPDLTFDMTRWQPDPEYYNDNTGPLASISTGF
ncbi:MAG: hypothetical protein ABSA82_09865 [Thermacetogeniaceae bacterium]|jgi:hypothetical protein